MLKIIQNPPTLAIDVYIKAFDMKPLQVGQIDDPCMPTYNGSYVLRTSTVLPIDAEIINLSGARPDNCWNGTAAFRVRLLRPDEPLIIELRNE